MSTEPTHPSQTGEAVTAGYSPGSANSHSAGGAEVDSVMMQPVPMVVASVASETTPEESVVLPTTPAEEAAPPPHSSQPPPDGATGPSAINHIVTDQKRITQAKHIVASASEEADSPGGAEEEASTGGQEVAPAVPPQPANSPSQPATAHSMPTKASANSPPQPANSPPQPATAHSMPTKASANSPPQPANSPPQPATAHSTPMKASANSLPQPANSPPQPTTAHSTPTKASASSPPQPATTHSTLTKASANSPPQPATAYSTPTKASANSPPQPATAHSTPTKARVAIQTAETKASTPKRVSSSRQRMERELLRLQQAEEQERLEHRARRDREVQKALQAVHRDRDKKGVTLTPHVKECRSAIRSMVREEERMALAKEQKKLRSETKALQQQIHIKYSVKGKKQRQDLVALAERFYQGKVKDQDGIPEHVQRELTRQEIEDLKMVFDMFDVKGRGFITPNDVKRAASMLGFKAKKEVFSGMIEEVTRNKSGRVTFAHFLQFVVRGQGDGDDPLEAILQCFRMLDRDQKGYITATDLCHAAHTQKVPLSNRAIREMIQEADVSGDSKVTSDEFIHIMLQSSLFRTTH